MTSFKISDISGVVAHKKLEDCRCLIGENWKCDCDIYDEGVDAQCSVRVKFKKAELINLVNKHSSIDLVNAIISAGAGLLEVATESTPSTNPPPRK